MTCMVEAPLVQNVGKQRHVARALDRVGEQTLLLVRHRRDAAGHDLAALGDEALEQLHVLVVDLRRVGATERAGLLATEEGTALAAFAATAASPTPAAFARAAIAAAAAGTITTVRHYAASAFASSGLRSPSGRS